MPPCCKLGINKICNTNNLLIIIPSFVPKVKGRGAKTSAFRTCSNY
nr:MAG TPA: hypothetical protein [Caudoviricetes sp.]